MSIPLQEHIQLMPGTDEISLNRPDGSLLLHVKIDPAIVSVFDGGKITVLHLPARPGVKELMDYLKFIKKGWKDQIERLTNEVAAMKQELDAGQQELERRREAIANGEAAFKTALETIDSKAKTIDNLQKTVVEQHKAINDLRSGRADVPVVLGGPFHEQTVAESASVAQAATPHVTTCREVYHSMPITTAKTIGIPESDYPFEKWLRNRDAGDAKLKNALERDGWCSTCIKPKDACICGKPCRICGQTDCKKD